MRWQGQSALFAALPLQTQTSTAVILKCVAPTTSEDENRDTSTAFSGVPLKKKIFPNVFLSPTGVNLPKILCGYARIVM